MSYLAMSAASINEDMKQQIQYDTPINKKRVSNNKTQKYRTNTNDFDQQKVNSILQSMYNNPDDESNIANYNPKGSPDNARHSDDFKPITPFQFPPKPISIGNERTKQEGMSNVELVPQPTDNDALNLQYLKNVFMNDAQVKDYYKKLVPNYNTSQHKTFYSSDTHNNDVNQLLLDKLNYMINLLEEQQDQKTNNVTEEVVLYSFLGVFIIFIVDSFTKIGKYTR